MIGAKYFSYAIL